MSAYGSHDPERRYEGAQALVSIGIAGAAVSEITVIHNAWALQTAVPETNTVGALSYITVGLAGLYASIRTIKQAKQMFES